MLVSVITPAHNAGLVIERAVRSVALQTVPVLEHWVIDDGSLDDTAARVAALRSEFPHVHYLHQSRRGAAAARNAGIARATGRYIAFLDSDDYWKERKLERQIDFMERTGAVFSYGSYCKCEAGTGRLLREYDPPEQLTYEDLLKSCPIGCLTAAYNQEKLGKVYMPDVRRGQDWGLWLALTRNGESARKYPGMEAIYHAGPGSLSSGKARKAIDMYRIYREHEHLGHIRSLYSLGHLMLSSLGRR